MMKRIAALALVATFVLGAFASAQAATEVKMTGDARIYGVFFANHNFTGWNTSSWTSATSPTTWKKAGTQTEDRFQIWERFRLRSDFVANEAVKFRLGIKVEDTWGHGTFTAANPEASLQVDLAYLQFKYPGTDIEITAGLQDVDLPQSKMIYASPVFGGERRAALTVSAPLIDKTLSVLAGFGRLIDTNRTYDTTTTQVADELDMYFLALPITLDGFKATPWGAIAVAGDKAGYFNAGFADYLMSAGSVLYGWKNDQNAYWWAGSTLEVLCRRDLRRRRHVRPQVRQAPGLVHRLRRRVHRLGYPDPAGLRLVVHRRRRLHPQRFRASAADPAQLGPGQQLPVRRFPGAGQGVQHGRQPDRRLGPRRFAEQHLVHRKAVPHPDLHLHARHQPARCHPQAQRADGLQSVLPDGS